MKNVLDCFGKFSENVSTFVSTFFCAPLAFSLFVHLIFFYSSLILHLITVDIFGFLVNIFCGFLLYDQERL